MSAVTPPEKPEAVAWDWQGPQFSVVSSSEEISRMNALGMGGVVTPLLPEPAVIAWHEREVARARDEERAAVAAFLHERDERADEWPTPTALARAVERGEHHARPDADS